MENKTMGFLLGMALGATGALSLLSPKVKETLSNLGSETLEFAQNAPEFVKDFTFRKKAPAPEPTNPWLIGGICGAVGATAAALIATNMPEKAVNGVKKKASQVEQKLAHKARTATHAATHSAAHAADHMAHAAVPKRKSPGTQANHVNHVATKKRRTSAK